MKILILGSTGTFGTAMEKICQEKKIDYIALNHKDFEITNKKDLENVLEKNNPDVVLNSVVMMGNSCDMDYKKAFEINSLPAFNLARFCDKKNIIFIQPSTHNVFDGKKEGFYDESDKPNPLNFYGLSKYMAELFTKDNCKKYYIIRFPTMFGPRRNSGLGLIDKVLQKIKTGEELRIADDKIDSPTYTLDVAKKVISMLEERSPYGIYHLTNSGRVSYYDLVSEILTSLNKNKSKLFRAKDSDFKAISPKPLKTAMSSIKLAPLRNWKEALNDYLAEIKNDFL